MKTDFVKELKKAQAQKYAIGAFNFDSLEMAKAIIKAAELENSPVILMYSEGTANYMGFEYGIQIALEARKLAKIPVILHWDHGFTLELVKKAVDAGFDSVMLDASAKSIAENIKLTREVVKYAQSHNVYVESEIGHVGGKTDESQLNESTYTQPEEALNFYDKTKVDALAIAFGTSHGIYKHPVNLDFDIISNVAKELNVPLVMHGSSGVSDDDVKKCVARGICKINIGTDIKVANGNAIRQWFIDNPKGFDLRKFNIPATEAMIEVVRHKIKIVGSANKA